jgi:ferredoxin
MGYAVSVDGDLCIGSGTCVATAPEAFVFDADGIATVVPAAAAQLSDAELLDIARNCPSGAITLRQAGEPVDL